MLVRATFALCAIAYPAVALAATPSPPTAGPLAPIEYVTGRIPASVAPISLADALDRIRTQGAIPGLVSVAVGTPGERADSTTNLPWLDIAIRTPSVGDAGDMATLWQADLILGAVSDLIRREPIPFSAVSGATISEVLPDGGHATTDDGAGAVAGRQLFADDPPDVIVQRIRDAAVSFGLEVVGITVAHPYTAAPMVILRTSDIEILRRLPEITGALFGTPPTYEGHYLEIQDQGGRPLVRMAASFRTGAGRVWNDASVEGVAAIIHGGVPRLGNIPPPSNLVVGLKGLRWRTSGGRLTGLLAGVRLTGAGTLTITATSHGRLLARGRVAFSHASVRRVALRLLGAPLSSRSPTRRATLQVQVVGRDASGRSVALSERLAA
jgi:hypothetical protein